MDRHRLGGKSNVAEQHQQRNQVSHVEQRGGLPGATPEICDGLQGTKKTYKYTYTHAHRHTQKHPLICRRVLLMDRHRLDND